MSAKEEIVSFVEFGEQSSDIVLLFSPFLPFNNLYLNDGFYNSTVKYKKVFSNISSKAKVSADQVSYENLLASYTEYIKTQNNKMIILIGFGIFTNLFVRLTKLFDDRISKLILIEPDFGNSILNKLFDGDNKPFHKKNYFIQSFTKDFDIPKRNKYLYKHFFRYIKVMEVSLREYLPQKISLKEILEIREKTLIMWHIMEKDLWPLPQILQEDYSIKTYSSNDNLIKAFITKDNRITTLINEYIYDNSANN